MNLLVNRFLSSTVVAVWIMSGSLWGCASKNLPIGSLKLKTNDYKRLLQKQMVSSHAEKRPPDKLPKMTDAAHEMLGDTYFRQGNLETAFMHYEQALRLNPNKTRIHYKKGLLFLARGGNRGAAEEFQRVLQKEPRHGLAHEGMGQALFGMGQFEDAKDHLQQALEADPKLWKAHNFLGIIHDYQRRPQEAVRHYQEAITLKPDEGLLYNNLGVFYCLTGEYEKAVAAFQEALKTRASHPKIHNNLGLALSKLGSYQKALEAFRRGGSEAQAYNNLGCIYWHQGKRDKAIRSFEKAMDLKPVFYAKASENLEKAKVDHLFEQSVETSMQTESKSFSSSIENEYQPIDRSTHGSSPRTAKAENNRIIDESQEFEHKDRTDDEEYPPTRPTETGETMLEILEPLTSQQCPPIRPIEVSDDIGIKKTEKKIPPLLVEKEVLAEYVKDRLSQLEEKEKLTQQQAVEVDFIRQNSDDPKKLADFYGMQIMKTIEEAGK